MPQRLAVAVIHGVGKQDANFADGMAHKLRKRFAKHMGKKVEDPASQLIIKPVYWAPVLQNAEEKLWTRMNQGGRMHFTMLRRFMVGLVAHAIFYQPTAMDRKIYDAIHRVFAQSLRELAIHAGGKAPLCVIAHSLGSVIASNYFYDLQVDPTRKIISDWVRALMANTPLERGDTLTLFYTLGSPLALWGLPHFEFGVPINVPSPRLSKHYPTLKGEWVNYYDKDDVIGYPLKALNDAYRTVIKADREINVGGLLTSWNPASHLGYWTDNDVTKPIAAALARTWRAVNR